MLRHHTYRRSSIDEVGHHVLSLRNRKSHALHGVAAIPQQMWDRPAELSTRPPTPDSLAAVPMTPALCQRRPGYTKLFLGEITMGWSRWRLLLCPCWVALRPMDVAPTGARGLRRFFIVDRS